MIKCPKCNHKTLQKTTNVEAILYSFMMIGNEPVTERDTTSYFGFCENCKKYSVVSESSWDLLRRQVDAWDEIVEEVRKDYADTEKP